MDQATFEILRSMTPEQKLDKVFELTELTRSLLRTGLRMRYPDATPEELHQAFLDQLAKCHNQNY